jgi:hypothetical protein
LKVQAKRRGKKAQISNHKKYTTTRTKQLALCKSSAKRGIKTTLLIVDTSIDNGAVLRKQKNIS